MWAKNLTARGHQAISGYPTWNQLDQIIMTNPKFPLAHDTDRWSPWSTRSLCSLVAQNRKRNILRMMAPCLFGRLSSGSWHCLDIRDCCEIANYIVYTQSTDTVVIENMHEDDGNGDSAVATMGGHLKKDLSHLLVQALKDWSHLPNKEYLMLASYASHALGILRQFRRTIDFDHVYLDIVVQLGARDMSRRLHSSDHLFTVDFLHAQLQEIFNDPGPALSYHHNQVQLLQCWSLSGK
jgi:hypothetical protein